MADISIIFDDDKLKELAEKALNNVAVEQTGMTVQECIERQIPKKPLNATADNGFVVHACPDCHSMVVRIINFCPDCGQKLEWEVLDEPDR